MHINFHVMWCWHSLYLQLSYCWFGALISQAVQVLNLTVAEFLLYNQIKRQKLSWPMHWTCTEAVLSAKQLCAPSGSGARHLKYTDSGVADGYTKGWVYQIGHINIGIIFLCIGNSQWCLLGCLNNTKLKSNWQFNTQYCKPVVLGCPSWPQLCWGKNFWCQNNFYKMLAYCLEHFLISTMPINPKTLIYCNKIKL